MKLTLYSLPNCEEALKIKNFLQNNNINFNEIILYNKEKKAELRKLTRFDKQPLLKIVKSHSINVIKGFNEILLNQLIEHIQKYKPKIKIE
jgi:arsenate reductase-like glutaredoxin family protein